MLLIDAFSASWRFVSTLETSWTSLSKTKDAVLQLPFLVGKKMQFHSLEGVSMKKISHRASCSALALSLNLACALPAMAQSTTGSGTGVGTTSRIVTDTRNDTDDRDYGWLGLLGLIGLAGLRRKKEDHTDVRHTMGASR